MTDATHAALTDYLNTLAAALLVRDWEVELCRDTGTDGNHATVYIARTKGAATIQLGSDFFARTPEERRQTLVHELLHLQTARVCRAMTHLAEQCDTEIVRYANKRLDEEEEMLVDRLARVLGPHLPLPPEGA